MFSFLIGDEDIPNLVEMDCSKKVCCTKVEESTAKKPVI